MTGPGGDRYGVERTHPWYSNSWLLVWLSVGVVPRDGRRPVSGRWISLRVGFPWWRP